MVVAGLTTARWSSGKLEQQTLYSASSVALISAAVGIGESAPGSR
jgi:hypothetical protein